MVKNNNRRNNKNRNQYKEWEEGNVVVYVDRPEDLERAIRKFKKLLKKNGIMEEVAKRQAYEKPSDKKRRKNKDARHRLQKDEMKRQEQMGNVKKTKKMQKTKDKKSKK